MDLYGTSAQAVAMGNMRNQQVRDLNDKINQHNQEVADRIQGVKEQAQTANTILDIQNTGKALWAGSHMPDKIKAYKEWKASGQPLINQEALSNKVLQTKADIGNKFNQAMSDAQESVETAVAPIAEASPSGASIAEEASNVTEGAGSKLVDGITSGAGSALKGDAVDAIEKVAGKATGIIGSTAQAGLDLYQDFKGGTFHLAGDNWEQKSGNALNLAGAVADFAGTFYPPLALVGGALDLASGAISEIGDKVSESKQASQLDQEQQKETLETVSAPPQQTVTTGRTE